MCRSRAGILAFVGVRLGALSVCLTGCFFGGSEATPFPPGLEPVGENTAPLPMGTPDDPFPEAIEVVHGEIDGVIFVHARGFIHAPPGKVWSALMEPDVFSDRRNIDSYSATFDVEPEYDFSVQVSYVVERVVTIEWDENWRYGVIEGTAAELEHGAIAFQKTFGTTFIALLEGSFGVFAIDGEPQITEYGFIEHLDTIMTTSDVPAQRAVDMHENIKAFVNDLPLPEY